jgi:hypothetical protein
MTEEIPLLSLERVGLTKVKLKQIKDTNGAVNILREVFEQNMPNQITVNEYFVALIMNKQNEVIGNYIVGKGGIDATVADIRLVMGSRGTPRIANNLLRRTRDFAQVKGNGEIDVRIAEIALNALDVDQNGLDEMDNRILMTIIEKFKGGPVGLTTIATACGEEAETIEEVYEPFLIQEGFLKRTSRGREATEKAYRHVGIEPKAQTGSLF